MKYVQIKQVWIKNGVTNLRNQLVTQTDFAQPNNWLRRPENTGPKNGSRKYLKF